MKVKLFGYQDVSFTDKDTGEHIEGTSLYIGYPSDYVRGIMTEKIFIRKNRMQALISEGLKLSPDVFLNLEYGPRGRLVSVSNMPNDK